jgi:hypothetical protein
VQRETFEPNQLLIFLLLSSIRLYWMLVRKRALNAAIPNDSYDRYSFGWVLQLLLFVMVSLMFE